MLSERETCVVCARGEGRMLLGGGTLCDRHARHDRLEIADLYRNLYREQDKYFDMSRLFREKCAEIKELKQCQSNP